MAQDDCWSAATVVFIGDSDSVYVCMVHTLTLVLVFTDQDQTTELALGEELFDWSKVKGVPSHHNEMICARFGKCIGLV